MDINEIFFSLASLQSHIKKDRWTYIDADVHVCVCVHLCLDFVSVSLCRRSCYTVGSKYPRPSKFYISLFFYYFFIYLCSYSLFSSFILLCTHSAPWQLTKINYAPNNTRLLSYLSIPQGLTYTPT